MSDYAQPPTGRQWHISFTDGDTAIITADAFEVQPDAGTVEFWGDGRGDPRAGLVAVYVLRNLYGWSPRNPSDQR